MKRILRVGGFIFAIGLAIDIWAQSPDELLRLAGPGPQHEQLAKYAGAWEVEIKMGFGPRGLVYSGTADNKMTVGNRFLQMQYQAKDKDKTLEGTFSLGFDRRHQKYAIIAMDSFGTYFVTSQETDKHDEKSTRIKMYGKDDDPMMKSLGFTKEFVHVVEFRGENELAVEVWFVDTRTPERREIKSMEFTFKRQK